VPPILVVLAFVLFYGRSGLLNLVLMRVFSLREPPLCFLFSLPGLVLVHGFYNFPIVLQNVGDVWARIPREREEAARSLGASPRAAFRVGALPSLLPALVQAAALVFLFCFFSFVVVLVFGPLGGSTLEVEIYRAVRFDADSSTAAALALIETTVALAVVFLLQLAESRERAAVRRGGAALPRVRPRGGAALALAVYALIIGIFFLGPLLCLLGQAFVVKQGMGGSWRPGIDNFSRLVAGGGGPLPHALLDSLVTALPAAFCATLVGALLAPTLRRRTGRGLAEAAFSLPLAVSGVVTALGWSLLFPRGNIGLVVLALAATALPFSLRSISASLASLDPNPALAARSLGAGRLRASLGIELPAVAPVLLSSAAFAFSMAAGDANVPILLGKGDFEPLPLLIYRLVGAYRFPEACAAGVVLALLTGFIFFLKDFGNARA
jgi:thiamine transport system permease protein